MVRTHGAVEADLLVGADALGHVGLAVVVEGLAEILDGAPYVAEVHERDLRRCRIPGSDPGWRSVPSMTSCHEGEVALAEGHAVVVGRDDVDEPPEATRPSS